MEGLQNVFKKNIRQYGMLIALVLIMALFQFLTDGILLKPQNVTNLILQNSYVIILAIGMILCIIAGGNIDLAVGSICAFVGAVVAYLIVKLQLPMQAAILAGLGLGLVIGIWQGFWIAYVRIPAFIVTLAGMLLFRGLTMVILQGQTIAPLPADFTILSAGYFPGVKVTTYAVGLIAAAVFLGNELTQYRKKKTYDMETLSMGMEVVKIVVVLGVLALFTQWLASYKGIPFVLGLLAVLILVYSFFTQKTVGGRYLYAFGGNEKAAKLSGINTNKVLFLAYVNMAVLAAVAGIMFTARLQAATPSAGTGFELDCIASCFIGGASAYGGIGTVTGAVIGAMVMGVLNNGMSIMGVGSDWQMAIKGFVLLLAVAFDVISKSRAK
jgi:putative multiple sugar transport system permease protein